LTLQAADAKIREACTSAGSVACMAARALS
jgi:hypothetical protein